LYKRDGRANGRLLKVRAVLLFCAVLAVTAGLSSFLATDAAGQAQEGFTITVSLGSEAGSPSIDVPVSASGSSVSGSKSWDSDSTEHDTSVSGTIEKGLDGNDRIIVDVKDSWYRPGDPAVQGDSGW
jgi:hypothetical protein